VNIPGRIIQTGKTRSLSPLAKAAVVNLKLLHPDWEYFYFDDDGIRRFVASEFPQYQAIFDAFPRTIQRIDFFRYLVVFRHGGFYFDLDVLLSESLVPLLGYGCVFPFEELTLNRFLRERHGMDWEIGNYAFGAAAGHPYLAAVIENCVRSRKTPAWVEPMMAGIPRFCRPEFEVLNTTGPGLLSRTLAENPDAIADLTVLFPEDVCDPESWHQFGDYGVHLMEGSWRTGGGYFHRRFVWGWESWSKQRLLPESRRMGPTRKLPVAPATRANLVSNR
jgi:inositol phosphorylceramide mannosyltransferase catalytic subunit